MKNLIQPGENITLLQSLLVHPSHVATDADNKVQSSDPCVVGGLVGVAVMGASTTVDRVVIKTRGVFNLAVVAKHAGGVNDAVAIGDHLFIDGATAVINKDATKTPFGIALGAIDAGATAAIDIKMVQAGSVAAVTVNAGPTDGVTNAVAGAAIPVASGTTTLGSGGALAMTLATPADPADNGKRVFVVAVTAHAHTVTTAANKIKNVGGASGDTLTFAAIGDYVELEALNGLWFVRSINGPVLSEV